MKRIIIFSACIAMIMACSPAKQNVMQESDIDEGLQVAVDSLLRQKMVELKATSGQAIVMEVQTGKVKVAVGVDSTQQESGLVRVATLLAALEMKAVKLSDTVDVGEGVLAIGADTLFDHNWSRGGYGKLTVKQSFGVASNVAGYKIAKKAFGNGRTFATALARYGYQATDTSMVYNPIGYGILTTPMQNLKFINAIARGDIADEATVDSMRMALEYTVTDGLALHAASEKVRVAGASGTINLTNDMYAAEFCEYFPADKPRYSIIVTINKRGLPVSGSRMAGDVFRQIVDYIICNNNK